MICADYGCQCAIESDSLTISGSGAQGDPWQIESNAFSIVTSATRPASPFTNQFIYETDTRRIRVWDGTYWRIVGGEYPEFDIQRQAALTISNDTTTTVTLPTEIVDSDGFHASSNGFITIPAGLGGVYQFSAAAGYDADGDGYRYLVLTIAGNTTPAAQNQPRAGGYQMTNTNNNGLHLVRSQYIIEAGATVTLSTRHNAGNALDLLTATFQGRMIRHMPELT